MKKKELIKSEKPKKDNVAKPLCGSYGGSSCTLNGDTGSDSDILF